MCLQIGSDWKWRTNKNKGKRYSIRLHRNYLNGRYCSVIWLLKWLAVSKIKSGPIFQTKTNGAYSGKALSEESWTGMTTKLFKMVRSKHTTDLFIRRPPPLISLYISPAYDPKAGLYTPADKEKGTPAHGCTNHAIRKTAVQWAARCKGSILDIKNNGRWKTMEEIAKYHSQGSVQRNLATEGGKKDGIWGMWAWKPVTVASFDGRDQM